MAEAPVKILLVDDSKMYVRFLELILEKPFCDVSFELLFAYTLDEAQQVLATGQPNLVVLDLCLPDSDGIETFRKIREATSLPIIVLTGNENINIAAKLVREGAIDVLVKGTRTWDQIVWRIWCTVQQQHPSSN